MSFHKQILWIAKNKKWPAAIDTPAESREIFAQGIDVVDGYRGQPQQLVAAMDVFASCRSAPLAIAGAAYTLIASSYISRGRYEPEGIEIARKWLAKAQELAPGTLPVDAIALSIDMATHDYDNLLSNLVSLGKQDSGYFHIQYAKLHYRCRKASLRLAQAQYKKLLTLAKTQNQLVMAHRRMMFHYMDGITGLQGLAKYLNTPAKPYTQDLVDAGTEIFEELKVYSDDDPWFWHNYSIFCLSLDKYWQAARYNKKALNLMEFGAALDIKKEIKKKIYFLYYFA